MHHVQHTVHVAEKSGAGEAARQALSSGVAAVQAGRYRHARLTRLHNAPCETRRFPDWSMRYVVNAGSPDRAVSAFLDGLQRQPSPETVRQAIAIMDEKRIGSIIVADESGRLPLGIFTLRDLLQTPEWLAHMATLPGYSAWHCGEVLAMSTVLPWWQFARKKRASAPRKKP
mgnify:CR=1 FL=1